jgi:Uma2 family endonuclease
MSTDILDLPRLTTDEYHRLVQVGAFGDMRVELVEGRVVPMSPMNPAHASALTRLTRLFDALFDERTAAVRQQCPVTLDETWEPHPDLVIAERGEWEQAHPRAQDIYLIIEVSDSTLREDLSRKVPRYAKNGVMEVWVVDLIADVVHVHRDPDGSHQYATEFDAKLIDGLGVVAFPDVLIPVVKLFPASRSSKQEASPGPQ